MVERNLAKVEVESSRLFSRSNSKGSTLKMLSFFIGGFVGLFGKAVGLYQADRIRRGNKAVMYRIANPSRSVRLRPAPPSQLPATSPSYGAFLFDNTLPDVGIRRLSLSGEIGRHSGLKIRRFVNNGRTGSIPVSGTTIGRLTHAPRALLKTG